MAWNKETGYTVMARNKDTGYTVMAGNNLTYLSMICPTYNTWGLMGAKRGIDNF